VTIIPAIAARHRDPIVRQFVNVVERLHVHRHDLGTGVVDRFGRVVMPELRELLVRLPPVEGKLDYDGRRSDGMASLCRVLCVLVSCCDWLTMEIRDPRGGYLSVARLAELAGHPYEPGDPSDRTERALRTLRVGKIIAYTKQHREKLEDGRHTSTGPALRKLAVGLFRKFSGMLLRIFDARRAKLKRRAERRDRAATAAGAGVDLRMSDLQRKMDRDQKALDEIATEHPTWSLPELLAERQRRRRTDTS
jgi:hypothetical protein